MSKCKLIYLASPYSHRSKRVEQSRYREINRIAAALHTTYDHAFILPITQSHILRKYEDSLGTTFKAWCERDLRFIKACDEVWVVKLKGWDTSVGIKAEIAFAKKLKIKVRYIKTTTAGDGYGLKQ